ncbi:MAG: hypothetical protein AAF193_12275, partial [Bacteroidota bacterium]
MTFPEYLDKWVKSEVLQGQIMIAAGIILAISLFFIIRGNHALLRGTLIPLGLLTIILVGYGGSILFSRPQHAKQSMEIFEKNWQEGVE